MLVDDVGLLHVVVAKIEERQRIDNAHLVARGITLGAFVGRQEGIVASAIGQSTTMPLRPRFDLPRKALRWFSESSPSGRGWCSMWAKEARRSC